MYIRAMFELDLPPSSAHVSKLLFPLFPLAPVVFLSPQSTRRSLLPSSLRYTTLTIPDSPAIASDEALGVAGVCRRLVVEVSSDRSGMHAKIDPD